MIESPLEWDTFPSWFFILEIDPTYLIYNLLKLVYASKNKEVLAVDARSMVFSRFNLMTSTFDDSPIVFNSIIHRAISIKAPIFEFLFVFRYSSI